jgi:phage replication O-like protein O
MASPQLENGYTKIANELLEALIGAGLAGQELAAALFIIRKTWGFNKPSDCIALSQISKALRISPARSAHVMRKLQASRIVLLVDYIQGLTKKYSINKDYHAWIDPVRKHTLYKNVQCTKTYSDPVQKRTPQKKLYKRKKEIYKEKNQTKNNKLQNWF